ncbi:MAG TPA: SRPBCC family protein [Solirubrobacterales bacterium]|jgi:hypothetical protein
MPWFSSEPVDESFFETAPVRMSAHFEVPRPAAEVWGELTGERPLHWCRILQDVRWTSPRPFGVGTTREVKALWGANLLREHYFRWEEGRQHSFYVVESTAPLAKRFAEDYLVEPTGEGSCRFTWKIVFEPKTLTIPAVPMNKLLLRTLYSDTRDHYGLG